MIPASSLLLWAHSILIWMIAHYTVSGLTETPRVAVRTKPKGWLRLAWLISRVGLPAIVVGVLSESGWLAFLMGASGSALLVARARWPDWHVWERELVGTTAFALGSLMFIERESLQLRHHAVTVVVTAEHLAVACLIVALFIFTLGGGTYIVRGILRASGVPQAAGPAKEDQERLKHGRWIGSLERAVLFVVLIAGSYEALGFIVAAKGLIRSRQFEKQRELTEYFLIGSLASVAVALATGTLARYVIQVYW